MWVWVNTDRVGKPAGATVKGEPMAGWTQMALCWRGF